MRRVTILFFAIITAMSSFSQTHIQDGDYCFDGGDYDCAVTNYNNAFINATGKDKQIAEIKLTRAKWCAEHIKTANQVFAVKNYTTAKDEYQKVLDSNPKDSYAQSQILKCNDVLNPQKLRKATAAELTDIWNNKYGVLPQRRQNLINVGIDPDDAQKRIDAGEGKPQIKENQVTNLSVSKTTLYFTSYGGTSEYLKVYTDASTYSVPTAYVPSWCIIKTYTGYFTVTVSENPNYTARNDWFHVTAGNKIVKINVEQTAKPSPGTQEYRAPKVQTTHIKEKKCFNCPKMHDNWGLTLGYTQQTIDNYSVEVLQFGLKAEPLFKYGFGLNTGLNLVGSSENSINSQFFEYGFDSYAVNIPLHMEYRLNFSKWFNIFGYGGVGFNVTTNPNFDNYNLPGTFEYGGGIRIGHVQFNVGSSMYLGNLRDIQNFGKNTETYHRLIPSISYMF